MSKTSNSIREKIKRMSVNRITAAEIKKYSLYRSGKDVAETACECAFATLCAILVVFALILLVNSDHPTFNLFNMVLNVAKSMIYILIEIIEYVCYIYGSP